MWNMAILFLFAKHGFNIVWNVYKANLKNYLYLSFYKKKDSFNNQNFKLVYIFTVILGPFSEVLSKFARNLT